MIGCDIESDGVLIGGDVRNPLYIASYLDVDIVVAILKSIAYGVIPAIGFSVDTLCAEQ